jgi:3-oxoacyl-[acyl-carrier protein] reductase
MRLKHKVAVVTGSSRGIGRAVALRYASEGASVVVHGSRQDGVAGVVAEIEQLGGMAAGCACSLGTYEASAALVDTAIDRFGGIDILVNNAGISHTRKLVDLSETEFDAEIAVNLKATFLTTQLAVQRTMNRARGGKIINVTSHSAFRGSKTKTAYAASKMGVIGMTLVWANELAGAGINVNCVAPAANTDMMKEVSAKRLPALVDSFERASVLGRMPEAEDTAPVFLFLASSESDFLTGQVLGLNGQPMHLL